MAVDIGAAGPDTVFGAGKLFVAAEPNTPPTAADDSATTDEDTSVTVEVLLNDIDADGDALTVSAVTQGAGGAVTTDGGTVTYTPDPNFNGVDSFTYTISDGKGGTDTANVTVTVNPVNDAPVANDDTAQTETDTAVAIDVLANDSDVDGDTITVLSVTQGANGSVVNGGDSVSYTPHPSFVGTDSFSYTIDDGSGGTDSASVTVTVVDASTGNVHVGDLDGSTAAVHKNWKAIVTVTIHDATHNPVQGATVTGVWSGGHKGEVSATTDAQGQCTVETSTIPRKKTSATFTVTGVNAAGVIYDADANHDPDGDSDGTTITVSKP
jgi:hypothetical protein